MGAPDAGAFDRRVAGLSRAENRRGHRSSIALHLNLSAATKPFHPIEKHGVIGDRRTGALVAADGTIDWWCLPDFDDPIVCGALLDPARGGFCEFGPEKASLGAQRYEDGTACLLTFWGDFELADLMPWPGRDRSKRDTDRREILRRLRAIDGGGEANFAMRPRWSFNTGPRIERRDGGIAFDFREHRLGLWTSFPVEIDDNGANARLSLRGVEEAWVMLGLDETPSDWNAARCRDLHEETKNGWRKWSAGLTVFPHANAALQRSAITVHLLAHAPNDAVVAAVTTSLPERIGGDRNYDYRYTWVRDASLSAAFLATMGHPAEVARYLDWLCRLDSEVDAPLQVCYRTDGQTKLAEREVEGVAGYRGSQPVRFGNRAAKQRQLGSLGYFADCALIFVEAGGEWKSEFTALLRRAAASVCQTWRELDSGVWELSQEAHYVASKVMAWVTLDRACRTIRRLGEDAPELWDKTDADIREEVFAKGWSTTLNAFRQRYDAGSLDAAALLIPLRDFLPPDDPRVLTTLDAIQRELVRDGFVYRFDPSATLGGEQLPIGEFEGAFLPATFWYAHALALAGRRENAAAVLGCSEEIAGPVGIFAEEADAVRKSFLGNTPLLFSQVEYARALIALHQDKTP
ncbi:MAG: glycoside hydrolase family 15 protein [Chthoniobacteraceae bacterium]